MENVWDKLKVVKGRSWNDTRSITSRIGRKRTPTNEIVKKYHLSSETLPEQDRNIYGLHLKSEPFFLERCKTCSRLLKSNVLECHSDSCHKKSGAGFTKKTTFVSPSKKKSTKRSNKSTSEDDSESVISSENSSPALDLQDGPLHDPSVALIRDDSMIDVISVEEIPSEDSKPPTPGPQDLYEEFTTPYSEEVNSFSSSLESSDGNKFKPTLKFKIISNKDANQKSHTSLLEAHLLSNTKYNTSSGVSNVDLKNPNYKLIHQTSLLEQAILKPDDVTDQTDPWKSIKTDTKISIPISVLPQNVKMKKQNVTPKPVLLKASLLSKDKADCGQPSSPFAVVAENENSTQFSSIEYCKEKSTRSKKNKRSKGKNRSARNADFDPDRHCGVLLDENKHCMRSLTCKTHSISSRRAVEGRSKDFDRLLADHRASREALKEQDRNQNVNLGDPIISIPILAVDKISGKTIQIPSSNSNEAEMIKVRVSNLLSSSESQKLENEDELKNNENEKSFKNLFSNTKASSPLISKCTSSFSRASPSTSSQSSVSSQSSLGVQNEKVKMKLYDYNMKISFVCSDMLYKIGGLLYTDRSRQAIRKCMLPLTSKTALQKTTPPKSSHPYRKITDFLQLVKNTANTPTKLSLLKEQNNDESVRPENEEVKFRSTEEINRMKNLLKHSSTILSNLPSDESELRKLKLTRLKRPADKSRNINAKRMKQKCITDENYDIHSLLSFDKLLLKKSNESMQFPIVSDDGFVCSRETKFVNQHQSSNSVKLIENLPYGVTDDASGSRVGYQENDTTQLWQTFCDLESEIRNTVGVSNIEELYTAQPTSSGYVNPELSAFPETAENDIEETISKNYSLLEEYCKNITTDELLLDGKGNYSFYGNSDEKNADNEPMYGNVDNAEPSFQTQVLNSLYLSGESATAGHQAIDVNDILMSDQFNVAQLETPVVKREPIFTLNKQFQDSTAVKTEKPPVYKETENEEVLMKWLF